jgi:CDP-glucose 4,6-dehydratase
MFSGAYHEKTVWLSGHTGFKGSWLALWLLKLGAKVVGFALPPRADPALFNQLDLAAQLDHQVADIRQLDLVRESIRRAQPDFVFHLAAQPLVRLSYELPVETYDTNLMGTIHVLDSLRDLQKPCAAVFITSDKCYANREWFYGYRENDRLGGYDPYSASKAAAEIVIDSYRNSFFQNHPVKIASARAGNVIGGGDWSEDRIVPDAMRALKRGIPIPVRNPDAVRPWQHVLEPLSGYLWLAARVQLERGGSSPPGNHDNSLCSAFNFGPGRDANRTVRALMEEILRHWPGKWEDRRDPHAVHEANLLQLCIEKASTLLAWKPVWKFSEAVERTVDWYRDIAPELSATIHLGTLEQIAAYTSDGRAMGYPWASE